MVAMACRSAGRGGTHRGGWPLPPMEQLRSMGAPMLIAAALRRCRGRLACGTRWPRWPAPSATYGPAMAASVALASPLDLDRRPRGGEDRGDSGELVEVVVVRAERAHARIAAPCVRAVKAEVELRDDVLTADGRRLQHRPRMVAAAEGGTQRRTVCSDRSRILLTIRPASFADQPPATTSQQGARALPAVRAVRSIAHVRQHRRAGRRRAQHVRHSVDRAKADRTAHACAR